MLNIVKKINPGYYRSIREDMNYYLDDDHRIKPVSEALKITVIYGAIGLLWILLSNKVLRLITEEVNMYAKFETYKGWAYVLITMVFIYFMVLKMLILFKKALQKANDGFEELRAQRNALIESEQRYELAVEGADCCIWDWNIENNICYSSSKWKEYLGFEDNEVESTFDTWVSLLHPEDKAAMVSRINKYISEESEAYEYVYRMKSKNGEYKWISTRGKAIRNAEGKAIRIVGSHTDVTKQKLIENRLNSLAYYDKLTELHNRFWFEEKVNNLIMDKNKQNKQFALIYMDVDNFKHVNNTLGHFSGDLLLKYISNILKYQVEAPDLVARLGGDEFGIVFESIGDRQDVANRIQDLVKHIRKSWIAHNQEFFISLSIGIAIYPEHGDNLSLLLKNSDIAMYSVKKNMKDNYCFYSPEIHERNTERIKMMNYLRHAIEYDEFNLLYQPIIDLNDGRLVGVEELIRWNHPIRGIISPIEFIPIAEETGLIHDIEKWVLRTALMQKKEWETMNYPPIKMSINISGKSITSNGFIDRIREILLETKVKCDEIQVEVTETAFMEDLDTSMKILKEIKEMGVHIALDDFGTGYSSLTYLKKLPIDIVKLDKVFIDSISNYSDEIIVENIIKLIHELKLGIVAEGIEIKDQSVFLKKNNCDYGQGYLFSKPVEKEEIEELLLLNRKFQ